MIPNPKNEIAIQLDIASEAFSGRAIYFRRIYEGYTDNGDALDSNIVKTIKMKFPKISAKMDWMLFYDSIDYLRARVHDYPFQHFLKVGDQSLTLFYFCNKKDLIFVRRRGD